MHDRLLIWTLGLLAGLVATVVAGIATRVRVLPEVIDAGAGYARWDERQHPPRR